ncbi:hypothetical protein D6_00183 [Faustovirus]|nr:hypothetical protein D6_00183 [Faustovirus]
MWCLTGVVFSTQAAPRPHVCMFGDNFINMILRHANADAKVITNALKLNIFSQ